MSILPEQYIIDLTNRINSIPDCKTLQKVEAEVLQYFRQLLENAEEQIEELEPFINPPTSLGAVISWIENFIGKNFLIPYENAILLEAELIGDIALLTQAIASKMANLSCVFMLVNGAKQLAGNSLGGNLKIGG